MTTLTAFRVAPQMEFKAAREIREAGGRAYVPRDRTEKRKTPTARGYVFANFKPAFAKHARSPIGAVRTAELSRLYIQRQKIDKPVIFNPGDTVRIKLGPFADLIAKLIKKRGRKEWLCSIPAKSIGSVCVQTHNMIRIDPG